MHRALVYSLILSYTITGCSITDKLKKIGDLPEMNPVDLEITQSQKKNREIAIQTHSTSNTSPNSLWKPGSRGFFRDQRSRSVGDILKVKVSIQDNAKLDNKTDTSRNSTTNLGVPNLLGLEKETEGLLPKAFDPKKALSINSSDTGAGSGKIDRKETINTTVAAMVIEILPNNNLFIKGSQEIRVNYELREITVEGVVRPEDISADNSVTIDQIAEARISYGGRGNLSSKQQDRYGKQFLDIINPF